MDFDSKKNSIKEIVIDLQRYVEKRIELKTLEYQEKSAALAAAVIGNSIGMIMVLAGLFFLLIAAGIGLGYLYDNMMFGFSTVALILIIVGFYIFKTKRNVLQNKIQLHLSLFVESVLEAATKDEESATLSSMEASSEPKEKNDHNEKK